MRVLVVDDSKSLRTYSINQLKRMGLNDIYEAGNGVDALKLLEEIPLPDLITLDINMPFMDGLTCLQHIRKNEKFDNVKILMVSSESEPKTRNTALKLGANEMLLKPFSRTELLEKFRNAQLIQ